MRYTLALVVVSTTVFTSATGAQAPHSPLQPSDASAPAPAVAVNDAARPPVEVRLTGKQVIKGRLVSLGSEQVIIESRTSDSSGSDTWQRQHFALSDVQRIDVRKGDSVLNGAIAVSIFAAICARKRGASKAPTAPPHYAVDVPVTTVTGFLVGRPVRLPYPRPRNDLHSASTAGDGPSRERVMDHSVLTGAYVQFAAQRVRDCFPATEAGHQCQQDF